MSILIAKKRRKGSHKTMARKWQNVSSRNAAKVRPAAEKPGQVRVKPPIRNQAPPKAVGVKPSRRKEERFFPRKPLSNTAPGLTAAGRKAMEEKERRGDFKMWESPFWNEDDCSRHLGNENCQCGKAPRYNYRQEEIEPGCPKPDIDLERVVSEETGRFG